MTLYDRIGVGYDTTRRADPGLVRCLLDALAVPAGSRCLDVACGTGNYTTALAEAGLQMVGVDVSRRMLVSARARTGAVCWVHGDAATLPFADRAFDVARLHAGTPPLRPARARLPRGSSSAGSAPGDRPARCLHGRSRADASLLADRVLPGRHTAGDPADAGRRANDCAAARGRLRARRAHALVDHAGASGSLPLRRASTARSCTSIRKSGPASRRSPTWPIRPRSSAAAPASAPTSRQAGSRTS